MPDPRKVMHRLAYHYLKVAGIEVEGCYDANKIAKGLSKIYRQCNKDEQKAKDMITEAGEYFNSKSLNWTPEAVWRDYELIKSWNKKETKQDVSERRKL